MPANLPPQYHEAEKEFRTARTPQAKIEALERMLTVMPHHKGTDHLRGELRSRIAKLQQEAEHQRGAGARAQLYTVRKEGAGQVALVGLPNAGKSALLRALTGAPAKVADYPFTTQLPQPAMMPFEDIHVQIVDLPPITPGETAGWIRGLLRQVDLMLLVVALDADALSDVQALLDELNAFGIAPVSPGSKLVSEDGLTILKKTHVVGVKLDCPGATETAELVDLECGDRLRLFAISSTTGEGLEALRRGIVDAAQIVRVYAKPPGRKPDLNRPFVFPLGSTVEDLAEQIHRELPERLKYAVLWAPDRPPLRVARNYVLRDRDVIELHEA